MPSRGQRSRATAKASWSASSARSKSRSQAMSAAMARPCSARNTCSTVAPTSIRAPLAQFPDWADLDAAAVLEVRHGRRHVDCLIQVVGLDDVVAAELFLGLGKRSVGEQPLAAVEAQRRGTGGRSQSLAA